MVMRKSKRNEKALNTRFFELAAYLATGARGCIEEPPQYGALRLSRALRELLMLRREMNSLPKDEFLEKTLQELPVSLPRGGKLKRFLDELNMKFAREAKNRWLKDAL
jgi:hypothetical protein